MTMMIRTPAAAARLEPMAKAMQRMRLTSIPQATAPIRFCEVASRHLPESVCCSHI